MGQRFLSYSRGRNPEVRFAEQHLRNTRLEKSRAEEEISDSSAAAPDGEMESPTAAEKRAEKRGGGAEHHFTGL